VHYGDALAPQNIPSGSTLFRGKRNGSVISRSSLQACRNLHLAGVSVFPRSTEGIRGGGASVSAVKVRSRRRLDWDLSY